MLMSGNDYRESLRRYRPRVYVNGQQVRSVADEPLLAPGEQFEYTSWTRIATPQGTMRGTYFCMTEDAHPFDAPVPEFMLARPEQLH